MAGSPLEKQLALIEVSKDVFKTTVNKLNHGLNRRAVFGGTFVAQALLASLKTVPATFKPFSMNCNFLVGGQFGVPLIYKVKRTRDGKNYATRQVEVYQNDKVLFITTVSFQSSVLQGSALKAGPQLEHQPEFPKNAPPPEEMVDSQLGLKEWLEYAHVKPHVVELDEILLGEEEDPVDWRLPKDYFHPEWASKEERSKPIAERSVYTWFKVKDQIADPQFHDAALLYCSDLYLLSSTNRAHLRYFSSFKFSVSLDHTIYFHKDFKADDWLLYEIRNQRTGGNRSLVTGKIFNQAGELVASTFQEGLAIIDAKNPFGGWKKRDLKL